MSDSMLDIRSQQYGRNIVQLAQQKDSKLYPLVYVKPESIEGKTFFQDRMGEWGMQTKASPNADTPENDPQLSRRMAFIKTEHDSRLIDRSLDLQVLSDPKSQATVAAAGAIGRSMDDEIITRLTGNSNAGESGSTTVSLPASQQIANGGTGLTFAKVNQAARILNQSDVESQDRVFIVSPIGLEDLLAEDKATSSDYVTIKSLQDGNVETWMGFKWIMSTRLSVASNIRTCIAFQKYGLCYGMSESPYVEVDKRADKSYSHQVYYEINHGGVRLEEERVVQVDIDESA